MLTVLLATRNRAQILREVLESYAKVQSPPSGWKLLVVDNGSTDQTAQVLADFADRLPLRALSEPKAGKNVALNRGLTLAEGDLVVFTDDDAFPHSEWLVQLRKAADAHPEYAMFGGAIVPRWAVSPPHWVRWIDDPGPVYTITGPSLKEGPVDAVLVFGPNMAVRNRLFQAGVRFDPGMGPRGTSYPMGSETDLLVRLERQGHKAWHVQNAVMEHFIRKEQMEKSWVLQRAVRYGRGRFRMSLNVKLWRGIPRHLFRDIPREGMLIVAAWISFRQKALFQAQWRFNTLRGMASEARAMARERQAQSQSALEPVD
jgi:glycosyltransferase involved in cell wall biosynthesis